MKNYSSSIMVIITIIFCVLVLSISIYRMFPGQEVRIEVTNQETISITTTVPTEIPGYSNGKVFINSAPAETIAEYLPGIGTTIAERIVTYRETNGPFHSVESLKAIKGIGDKMVKEIRDYISLEVEE